MDTATRSRDRVDLEARSCKWGLSCYYIQDSPGKLLVKSSRPASVVFTPGNLVPRSHSAQSAVRNLGTRFIQAIELSYLLITLLLQKIKRYFSIHSILDYNPPAVYLVEDTVAACSAGSEIEP